MGIKGWKYTFLGCMFFLNTAVSWAQETSVMIRAKSKDAKFIGSSIGGAKIIVREVETGRILAEGKTSGSTGDTDIIMKEPVSRGNRITNEDTAGFLAILDITQPVFVEIEAIAPVNKKQASVSSSTQLWVIPGKDITGDGVILEVPGLVIDILSPQTHERIDHESEITITANVILMCGCPITQDGIWDAANYEVQAVISRDGNDVERIAMDIQDKPSTFSARVTLPSGLYEITVYAIDPENANTGVDRINFIVE